MSSNRCPLSRVRSASQLLRDPAKGLTPAPVVRAHSDAAFDGPFLELLEGRGTGEVALGPRIGCIPVLRGSSRETPERNFARAVGLDKENANTELGDEAPHPAPIFAARERADFVRLLEKTDRSGRLCLKKPRGGP